MRRPFSRALLRRRSREPRGEGEPLVVGSHELRLGQGVCYHPFTARDSESRDNPSGRYEMSLNDQLRGELDRLPASVGDVPRQPP